MRRPPATRNLHPPRDCPECHLPVPAGIVRHRECYLHHEQERLAWQDTRDRKPLHPMTPKGHTP